MLPRSLKNCDEARGGAWGDTGSPQDPAPLSFLIFLSADYFSFNTDFLGSHQIGGILIGLGGIGGHWRHWGPCVGQGLFRSVWCCGGAPDGAKASRGWGVGDDAPGWEATGQRLEIFLSAGGLHATVGAFASAIGPSFFWLPGFLPWPLQLGHFWIVASCTLHSVGAVRRAKCPE